MNLEISWGAGNLSACKIETLLFLTCFVAFSSFHQGGSWGQNARFALVRAIVERAELSIDSYLIYLARDGDLTRVPIRNGAFQWKGQSYALAWEVEGPNQFVPVAGQSEPDRKLIPVTGIAVSGDVAFRSGHFYPNKAPGTSFAAVPPYLVIYHVERVVGANPDDWRILTRNAWLTSVFSVGVICAAGCVIFYRLALRLSAGDVLASALTAFTFAFGTMFFSYATMLQDHSLAATGLLAAFYFLYRLKICARDRTAEARSLACLAGLCLGLACLSNYIAGIAALAFPVYLISQVNDRRCWVSFGVGLAGPLVLIAMYHVVCFGTPLTTNYTEMHPSFREPSAFLGLFNAPRWDVSLAVLFSPFRGLFFSSPILLLGIWGLWRMVHTREFKAEARLFIAVAIAFLACNVCFIGWDSGWATGPRYLAPALPFLAAPAVFAFIRFFRIACVFLIVSIAINLLYTAVDPQSPLGVSPYASVADRQSWTYNQLTEYELPLFLTGHASPILDAKIDEAVSNIDRQLAEEHCPDDVRASRIAALRRKIQSDIEQGWSVSFGPFSTSSRYRTGLALAGVTGPVSANPIGIYEGGYGFIFPLGTRQAQWNSFNLGEFIFPQSRLSLLPLLLVSGALAGWVLASAREKDRFFCSR